MRSWIAEFSQFFKINMFLSLFLDRAIDRGCIVPIVYEKDGFICRAYRHGEDVEFGQEQERMCAYMLKALAQSSNSSSLLHTIVEKTLVMFLRIGLEQGFFNYWEGKLGDFQSMGIRFSLHGAVGATATEKLYHTADSCSLTNIMEEHGYISRKEKKDPWSIEDVPQGGVHPNFANKAIQIGSLLGKLVHKEAKGTTYHLNMKDLILIATCLYPKDIAGALAAEIDIATRHICYEKFDYTASGLLELPSESLQDKIKELRSTIFFFAANNGIWKYRSYMAQKPWEIIERVSSSLVTDMIYKTTWDLFWPPEKRKTGDAIPINLKKIISREGLWLYKLLTICLMLEIALLWAQRDSRGESLKKKLKALKECSVNIQTYFPKEKGLLEDIALLEERIVSGKLQLHKLLSYIEKKFVYLIGETRDILAEVDTIATNIGQPEKISYYSNVLHIELTTRHPTRGNLWRRCHKIFHGIRGRARGQEKSVHTYLLEIPRKGLSVPHGLWIAASGPLSHTWLVRLASQILKELGNKAIIRCTLFRDLPDNGLLRRPENSSEFIGPTFWARADLIIHNKLGESNFSELITVVDDSHVDKQEAIRSIRKEANKVVNFTYSSETHHLLEPVPYNVSLYKFPYIQSKKTQIKKVEKMDIGIITVVPDELVAVNQILKKHPNFKERQGELSVRHFYEGNLPAADGKFHSVVCTRAQEQGSRAVMAAYQALAEEYSPTLMVLLGIGGSIHKDIELCDVVFAENIWYYDKRAVTEKGTQRRAIPYNVVPWLRNAINRLYDDFGDTPRLPAHNQSTDKKFSVFFGPIGTGEAVIRHRDAEERQWLQKVSDKTLVLETEAGGVAQQFCEDQLRHGFKPQGYLILRGVSDHADKEKDDAWRIPAAANAMLALGKLTSMSKAGFEDKIPKS